MTHQFDNVGSEGSAAPSHTPGPWTVGGELVGIGDDELAVRTADGIVICGVWEVSPDFDSDEKEVRAANARLIAAAPDLLAELQWLVTECESLVNRGHVATGTLKRAKTAIARAKGSQHG